MKASERGTLTAGEAARQLDVTIDALLELVYRGEIIATVQRETGRLLIDESVIERWGGQEGEEDSQ